MHMKTRSNPKKNEQAAAGCSCAVKESEPALPTIVMPPGSDYPPSYKELVTYYQSKSSSAPLSAPGEQAAATRQGYAVSAGHPVQAQNLTTFLEAYKDTCLCLEYWAHGCECAETCGILKEIGQGFLVLEDPDTPNLIIAELQHVRLIRLFCRKS